MDKTKNFVRWSERHWCDQWWNKHGMRLLAGSRKFEKYRLVSSIVVKKFRSKDENFQAYECDKSEGKFENVRVWSHIDGMSWTQQTLTFQYSKQSWRKVGAKNDIWSRNCWSHWIISTLNVCKNLKSHMLSNSGTTTRLLQV